MPEPTPSTTLCVLVCEVRGPERSLWPIVRCVDPEDRPAGAQVPMQILSGQKNVPLATGAVRRALAALLQHDTTRQLRRDLQAVLDESAS